MTAPRDTHILIATYLRLKIKEGKYTRELPSMQEIADEFGVARSAAMRALYILRDEGHVEVIQGDGTYVSGSIDRTSLVEKITDLMRDERMAVGAVFPSESQLCKQFGVSRPKLRTALAHLQGQGLIGVRIGQQRVVCALPPDKEDE